MNIPHKIQALLEYPLEHVKDPILYHLVKDYELVPNIHRAKIDAHEGGMLELELTGERDNLFAGLEYLKDQGVKVTEL